MHVKTEHIVFLTLHYLISLILNVDGGRPPNQTVAQARQKPKSRFCYRNQCPILQVYKQNYLYINGKYYAKNYDTTKKIPLYVAYTVPRNIIRTPGRENSWFKDPALSDEQQPSTGTLPSGLHRGHLYPQFYAGKTERKKATNCLTNFAPQYGKFNLNTWKRLEKHLFEASTEKCHRYIGAKLYFLTGVIPSVKSFVNRINIPTFFWTAVCCDTSETISNDNRQKGWSFAYKVPNIDFYSLNINMYFVKDFLNTLKVKFVQLFATFTERGVDVPECLFNRSNAIDVIQQIVEKNGHKDKFMMKGLLSTLFKDQENTLHPQIRLEYRNRRV